MTYVLTTFANQPVTTVTTGGTAAPASNTSEQWTVASSTLFPSASLSAVPTTGFSVADTASTSEIIAVTAVTGNVWGVIRGAEGTTPVTHATNFGIMQVITAGDFDGFEQYINSGPTVATTQSGANHVGTLASYVPVGTDIPGPGVVYDINAYGILQTTTATVLLTVATTWNGTVITSMVSNLNGTLAGLQTNGTFWIEGRVNCYGATTLVSGMNLVSANSSATHTISTMVAANPSALTITGGAGTLSLITQTTTGMTVITTGALIHRIA